MKTTRRLFLIFLLFMGFSNVSQAQFLNKLKNRIIEKTTDAVTETAADKVADKAAKETSKAMEGILSPDLSGILGPIGKMKDIETLPSGYQFDHIYSLKMLVEGKEMQMDYFLNNKEPYLGANMNLDGSGDLFIIFDEGNKALVTLVGGKAFATDLNYDPTFETEGTDFYKDYKITNLPNKTYLGYDCIGRLIESEEIKMTVYIAPKIGSGFGNVFKNNQAKVPVEMKNFSKQFENGLMMYMESEDKSGKTSREKTIFECIAFDKTDKSVKIR